MLKRLELQSMRADLQTILGALQRHTPESDPMGSRQFQKRAEKIQAKIREYEDMPVRTAHVALFFGGRPVLGSHGIDASFGSRAIGQFQDIVSTRYASKGRQLGARGPVANRGESDLLIRDVARGSFGFILEEDAGEQLLDTPLKEVLTEVVDTIYRIGAPDEEAYEHGLEELDDRLLAKLKEFFQHLDKSSATIRIVDEDREFALNRDAIQRGRERTEGMTITDEAPLEVRGQIFLLPVDKRFELHPADGGPVLRGPVSAECMAAITDEQGVVKPGVLGQTLDAVLQVKTVHSQNREDKRTYRLSGLGGLVVKQSGARDN